MQTAPSEMLFHKITVSEIQNVLSVGIDIRNCCVLEIERATGIKLRCHERELSDTEDCAEQVAKIKAWDRVNAWTAADGAMWN